MFAVNKETRQDPQLIPSHRQF